MKQNSIKIVKSRILNLKQKKLTWLFLIKKSMHFSNNLQNKKKIYYLSTVNRGCPYVKKICASLGRFKSVNKKLKLSRNSINLYLINNILSFYKNK